MIRNIASIIMFSSGFIMMSDVIMDYFNLRLGIENLHGFNSETNMIAFLAQWFAIFLILISSKLAHTISYSAPLYSTFLSVYWVHSDSFGVTKPFFVISVLGLTLLSLIAIAVLKVYSNKERKLNTLINEKNQALEEFLDLTILFSKKTNSN
jgi:hypothetical protein